MTSHPTINNYPHTSWQRRQIHMLEKKLRQQLGKSSEQIRQAAEMTAEKIWSAVHSSRQQQLLLGSQRATAPIFPSFDALSLADGGDASSGESSSARAIRRGRCRANQELNEVDVLVGEDFGSTTATSTTITTVEWSQRQQTESPKKNKKSRFGPLFKKKKKDNQMSDSENLSENNSNGDGWMCGVCGRAFSSFAAATRHETKHIQEVITGLSWTPASRKDALQTRTSFGFDSSYRNVRSRGMSFDDWEEEEKRDDEPHDCPQMHTERTVIPGNSPARFDFGTTRDLSGETPVSKPLPRVNSDCWPVDNQQDPMQRECNQQNTTQFISKDTLDPAVLADEALLNVCRQAEKQIIKQNEIQAERELALLTRDKAYYDEIKSRAVARQKPPTDRNRLEGKGLLGKVQNKLLDAYRVIKKAEDGSARLGVTMADRYTKRRRQVDVNSDEDIISHTGSTLYVNVIVRNGVQVVQHELNRLSERGAVDAHRNIVKLAGIALASEITVRQ